MWCSPAVSRLRVWAVSLGSFLLILFPSGCGEQATQPQAPVIYSIEDAGNFDEQKVVTPPGAVFFSAFAAAGDTVDIYSNQPGSRAVIRRIDFSITSPTHTFDFISAAGALISRYRIPGLPGTTTVSGLIFLGFFDDAGIVGGLSFPISSIVSNDAHDFVFTSSTPSDYVTIYGYTY